MTSERIKEIQQQSAYPDSVSVQQALLQVWNECSASSQTENIYTETEEQKEKIVQIMEADAKDGLYKTEISDEEIEKWAKEYTCKEYERLIFDYENYDEYRDFVNGAKKYREQLKLKQTKKD